MACPEEELPLEPGKARQTACLEELGIDGSKTPPCSGSETSPESDPADVHRIISVRGIHALLAGESRSRLFPESLYLFIHDGALHRYIACNFWVRIWLLFAAFLSVSIVFMVPLTPVFLCGRAVYLARFGRLADLGDLSYYPPCLPIVFFELFGSEAFFYICWHQFRLTDTHNFGPEYRFPILYICLRAIEHYTWLMSISLLRRFKYDNGI